MSRIAKLIAAGVVGGGGQLNLICPAITPVLGVELLTNGNMETGDPPSNWTPINSVLSSVAEERTGGAGSKCLSIARAGSNFFDARQSGITAAGDYVQMSGWFKKVDAAQTFFQLYNMNGATLLGSIGGLTDATWTQKNLIGRAIDTAVRVQLREYSTGADGVKNYCDDVSLKVVTFSSMLTRLGTHAKSGTFQCTPTVAVGSICGLVFNFINENNFAMIVVDRTNGDTAKLVKRVNGTYSADVITGAVVYGDGKLLKAIVSGTSYSLYYDGTQVGTTQTISDALGQEVYGFNTLAGNTVGTVTTTNATA